MSSLEDRIEQAAGSRPKAIRALGGGSVATVREAELENGERVVVKVGQAGSRLDLEGFMLGYLGEHGLPVPDVLAAEDDLLVMGFVDSDGQLTGSVERHAAELLADLHDQSEPGFGFARDTLIAGLPQPNPRRDSWVEFFRDQRLLFMARQAVEARRLPGRLMGRIETFCGGLERWLNEPAAPSLLHGDMWTGNVLCRDGKVTAFIDPAIYYGHAEVELAFSTLFGTFGRPFFLRYQELRGVAPGFFEERRDIYNLYPLLVHVRLFGGSYVGAVEQTLDHHGF
jgi:fructosamine-3-kinase